MYQPIHQQFRLEWDAAPRPPAHMQIMRGRSTFPSFESAVAYMQRQPEDSTFVSLVQIDSYSIDRTEDAATALSNSERADG